LKFTNLRNITNPIPCTSSTPLQPHFPLLFALATEVTSLNKSFFFSLVHTQSARKPDKTPYNPHLLFFFFLLLSPTTPSICLATRPAFLFPFHSLNQPGRKNVVYQDFSGRDSELGFCKKKQ
jgi:hypothetical protein